MDYMVFAVSDNNSNGGFSVDYIYDRSLFKLDNNEDELIFYNNLNVLVDQVNYNSNLGGGSGYSKELNGLFFDNNNFPNDWSLSELTYGLGDFGTPGTVNSTNISTISFSSDSLYFGYVDTSITMQRDFSILNELLDTLHITDVIFNNNDLSVSPIEQSILFGTSGNISVLWNPSSVEDLNDSLQIFSNDLLIGTIYLFGESTTSSPIISISNDGLDFWVKQLAIQQLEF